MSKLNHKRIASILGSTFQPVTKRTKFKGLVIADHTGPHGEMPCPSCEKFKKRKAGQK
jgi:hypothetical protein